MPLIIVGWVYPYVNNSQYEGMVTKFWCGKDRTARWGICVYITSCQCNNNI